MNWEEAFIEFYDQLFWSGYSVQLMQKEPLRYLWELSEFVKLYA